MEISLSLLLRILSQQMLFATTYSTFMVCTKKYDLEKFATIKDGNYDFICIPFKRPWSSNWSLLEPKLLFSEKVFISYSTTKAENS